MSQDKLKALLQQVKYPGFSKDVVTFGLIQNVNITDNGVELGVKFSTEKESIRQEILSNIEKVLREGGYEKLSIEIIQTPVQPTAGAQNPKAPPGIPGVKHTIAVASGKGGVGKSTIAANLAAALRKQGHTVGILDLDVFGPSLPITMGIHEVPKVLEGNKLQPIKRYDMSLMSLGFLLTDNAPVIWRGAMVTKMVSQFLFDVEWGALDYLILDLPPGTGDVQLTLVQQVALTGAVIVTTPQDLALKDVERGANMFEKVNTPVLGIIENMSYHVCEKCGHVSQIFSTGGGDKESERLKVPLLAKIPLNEEIMRAGEKGEPLVIHLPESEAAGIFRTVASKIHELMD
ncbi:MAG: Mrp/NBP35 family ATP-binding protein [Candidatus Marinimicrobia bacterium]|nr:Mrp/NBP35 family ATP-binding protein [Candidatus Neomarinimicrobiota bacterium]